MVRTGLAEEIMGVSAARVELSKRVRRLQSGDLERVVIVRQNSPVAVILTVEEYERMQTLDELKEDILALGQALAADDGTRISLDDLKAKLGIR
jgi:prevent-host-death family protein